jgi:hypothetical protein
MTLDGKIRVVNYWATLEVVLSVKNLFFYKNKNKIKNKRKEKVKFWTLRVVSVLHVYC